MTKMGVRGQGDSRSAMNPTMRAFYRRITAVSWNFIAILPGHDYMSARDGCTVVKCGPKVSRI
jgi:hypothetical protein